MLPPGVPSVGLFGVGHRHVRESLDLHHAVAAAQDAEVAAAGDEFLDDQWNLQLQASERKIEAGHRPFRNPVEGSS